MTVYLEIAVNVPQVSGVFHYHLPPALEGQVCPGHLVIVPFGKQTVQGIVLQEISEPAVPETRPVTELVDPKVVVTREQIALARHLSDTTLSPMAACVDLLLPTGLSQHADTLFSVSPKFETYRSVQALGLTELQTKIIKLLLKRGPLRGRQINHAFPRTKWRLSAAILSRHGLLKQESILPPPTVQPKKIRNAQLAVSPHIALEDIESLGHTETTRNRRQAILRALIREAGPVDLPWIYAESGGKLSDLHILADMGLITLGETETWRDPLENVEVRWGTVPPLTQDQLTIWGEIYPVMQQAFSGKTTTPFLLYGVTGSGKTEIYIRAVAETLQNAKQAIVLVPEIALTPQTVRRFMSRFPGQVGLVHSRLSPGERYDTWRRARDGKLSVIVGPRSALFTSLPEIGLIVVDECHDNSYYQSEILPYYNARDAALVYARLAGAVCILGSATPNVETMYQGERGRIKLLKLPERILAHKDVIKAQMRKVGGQSRYQAYSADAETIDLPPVRLVDMRQELKGGNRSIFSRALQENLAQTLDQNHQAILFLNRRGTATYVFCRDCGYSLQCPRCEQVSLTYHRSESALICHHCGYRRRMPKTCPQCGSQRIRHYGTGTEQVEDEVKSMFPNARTLRWDWGTTRKKGSHDLILQHFANQQADVLIGTQMLAKGLDLPLVTLVGVVLADVGLNLPDFRAGERTFQILTQVAGRAGRSPLGGQIVLQTFDPEHYVIQFAARHDYSGFYRRELAYRRELGYPPFRRIVRLEYRHTNSQRAEDSAQTLANRIRKWLQEEGRHQTELVGPTPCFYSRLEGEYRWQILLRGPDPVSLLRNRKLPDWKLEVNPQSLL